MTTVRGMQHALPAILRIGSERLAVSSLHQASVEYQKRRDQSNMGARDFPQGLISIGRRRFHISYNGRVWEGDKLHSEAAPCES